MLFCFIVVLFARKRIFSWWSKCLVLGETLPGGRPGQASLPQIRPFMVAGRASWCRKVSLSRGVGRRTRIVEGTSGVADGEGGGRQAGRDAARHRGPSCKLGASSGDWDGCWSGGSEGRDAGSRPRSLVGSALEVGTFTGCFSGTRRRSLGPCAAERTSGVGRTEPGGGVKCRRSGRSLRLCRSAGGRLWRMASLRSARAQLSCIRGDEGFHGSRGVLGGDALWLRRQLQRGGPDEVPGQEAGGVADRSPRAAERVVLRFGCVGGKGGFGAEAFPRAWLAESSRQRCLLSRLCGECIREGLATSRGA